VRAEPTKQPSPNQRYAEAANPRAQPPARPRNIDPTGPSCSTDRAPSRPDCRSKSRTRRHRHPNQLGRQLAPPPGAPSHRHNPLQTSATPSPPSYERNPRRAREISTAPVSSSSPDRAANWPACCSESRTRRRRHPNQLGRQLAPPPSAPSYGHNPLRTSATPRPPIHERTPRRARETPTPPVSSSSPDRAANWPACCSESRTRRRRHPNQLGRQLAPPPSAPSYGHNPLRTSATPRPPIHERTPRRARETPTPPVSSSSPDRAANWPACCSESRTRRRRHPNQLGRQLAPPPSAPSYGHNPLRTSATPRPPTQERNPRCARET
jgi:hypothetical protein